MKPPRFPPVILTGLALSWAGSASACKLGVLRELADIIGTAAPVSAPAASPIEVSFSPKGGAEVPVLRVIDSAKTDVKALSHSFTNPRMMAALLYTAKREVTVSLVAGYKNSATSDRSGKGRVALSALVKAGYGARVISAYPVHHDKVLIMDRQIVKLGSFSYSDAAAHANSGNAPVDQNSPALTKAHPTHFDHN